MSSSHVRLLSPLAGLLCLLAVASSPSRADTVFLKNGNTMEGVVVREDARELELDIGYGTVTLSRADIRRVSRAAPGAARGSGREGRRKAFDSGRSVPAAARGLQRRLQELEQRREAALDAKSSKADLEEEQERLVAELDSLKGRYGPAKAELEARRAAGPAAYNEAVRDLNEIGAGVQAAAAKLERTRKELADCDKEVRGYQAAFEEFKDALAKDGRYSGQVETGAEERDFYAGLKDRLREMERDFGSGEAASERRGPHVVVKTLLDGKVRASLLVDTGATVVALSQRVYDRLGLGPESVRGEADVTLADGRRIKARVVVLDSVEVGGMRARQVEAAVLPDSDQQTDGLLGMSFLRNFSFRLDVEKNRLVLKALR